MEAFRRLGRMKEEVWLAVVGEGPEHSHLADQARAWGLSPRVILAGARPHGEIANWMSAADVFALPSYNEGVPMVVYEAMACALPVVATRVGGIPEVALHETTALLVPPRAVEPLVQALQQLVESADLRRAMGRAGHQRVHRAFLWPHSAHVVLDLYRETLARRERSLPAGSHGLCHSDAL
jgi:glycosyltransferase involved in cell wall biosynthesis